MESWPVGEPFALRPHTQRITLAVIMRAVFGVHDEARLARFERLIDDLQRSRQRRHRLPAAAPRPRALEPVGRASCAPATALDEFIYEEIALRRAEGEATTASATTSSRCCSALATTTAAR